MREKKKWPIKVGEPTVIGTRVFGRALISQKFFNPKTGKTIEWSLFDAKKGDHIVLVSTILPITLDGKVVAIEEFRHGPNRPMLKLPIGTGEFGKITYVEIAQRELGEETGYEAESILQVSREPIWVDPGCTFSYHAFLASGCRPTGRGQNLDAEEDIVVQVMALEEWIGAIHSGLVVDQQSITTTFLALPHLGIELKK